VGVYGLPQTDDFYDHAGLATGLRRITPHAIVGLALRN